MGQQREPDIERYRGYAYHHANRLTQVVSGTLTTQYAYNGDGNRVISKAVDSATTQYILDLAPSLPVVMSGTERSAPTAWTSSPNSKLSHTGAGPETGLSYRRSEKWSQP